jgi:molybdenum cofactor biosynthesis protein MoaC/molybdopterin converting factor subunit 1
MIVAVRLFAILRERAGRERVELELPQGATVAQALQALARVQGLEGVLERLPVQLAVNREYASAQTRLQPEDELALIPPLSGGAPHALVSDRALSLQAVTDAVRDPRAGAVVSFQGVTREVARLDYEAYSEMASERIALIVRESIERHGLCAAAAEHRVGDVPLGEPSVVVAASAPHRAEAFAGAREIIDRIKAEAPIWKREHTGDGSTRAVQGTPPPGAMTTGAGPAPQEPAARLTHVDEHGRARMVDVGDKQPSRRVARARALVRVSAQTAHAVQAGDAPKGDVLLTARLAGIQAAKRTHELIPLAHQLALSYIDVSAVVDSERGLIELTSEAHTVDRTGVEMEALTACAVAALTVYDMVKALERGITIERVELLEKRGGRGDWRREEPEL